MSDSSKSLDIEQEKPELDPQVEALVRKAREASLLALQLYNTPLTVFKTEGYSVMMVVAWTALFHAVFEKTGVKYFYTNKDTGAPIIIDGDEKAWELGECMKRHFGSISGLTREDSTPVQANLEFFIKLRNKIEHRYVPEIDPHVAGECQALLFNFDEMLTAEFGAHYAIRESLAVPLQTARVRTTGQTTALRKLQARHFDEVREFVDAYRASLPSMVYEDQGFSFRVFLVPKTGNHATSAEHAIEFVKYDPNRAEEMKRIQKDIVLIKDRQVPVSNANLLSPTQVAKEVSSRIGRRFILDHHRRAWAKYQVRASRFDAGSCDPRYCVPDPRHRDYSYTRAWVEFLVQKLTDQTEYDAVLSWKQ